MRALFFTFCLFFCLTGSFTSQAQEAVPDQVASDKVDRPKNKWYAPDYVVAQHAGLIGILAAGIGYDFGKHDRTNAELMYGFTPNYGFKNTTHTFTTRVYYQSHPKPLFKDVKISWIKAGAGISMTIGEQFETFFPKKYPDGYYIWPTATRILPFVGSSLGREFKGRNRPVYGEFYGEIGSSEVMIIDKYRNKGISIPDILNLAIGVRVSL
ncbi:hypothetical protein ACD591_05920 [Rufibacter glacialis]|uniref:Outer membrane protein beta-barrel domain-containing protein n=1 Tax=Rufibacter glacialis TaxID=1259555 RepID=A0A5M8QDE0_9BACT|nr:hypothetical protein [Rufibacter glacialis]KAA6433198.1 hypothetical protein FOE74_11970 [Rufibacter glacialis]GGK76557.1 hypothetical protein GCM10011405_25440 [Rufibacter glacialis]